MRLNGWDHAGANVLLRSCVGSLALLPQLMGRRISLTSFDGEGEEREREGRQAGLASRNDDDGDGREERRNKKLQMNSLAEWSYDQSPRNIV